MMNLKRWSLVMAGLTLSVSAWALTSPSVIQQEIEQAVSLEREGKNIQAKQLYEKVIGDLDEVIATRKTNAKAHYWKSQALVHLNRFEEAQTELNAAKQYDPLLRFGSAKSVDDLQNYILRKQGSSFAQAPVHNNAAGDRDIQRLRQERQAMINQNLNQYPATSKSYEATQAKDESGQKSQEGSGSAMTVVLMTFVGLGLMFGGIYWLNGIMNRKKEATQYEEKKKKMMARAVNQKTQAQEYADMAKFENVLDKPFGQKAVSMNASIAQDIQDIKDAANGQTLGLLEQNLEQNARQLRQLEAAASIRQWDLINASKTNPQEDSMSQEAHGAFRQPTNPTYANQGSLGNAGVGSQPTTVIHEHHTTHVDSSQSLLQTMILADALRSNDHNSSYREREQDREIERLNRRLDEEREERRREERREQQERDSRDSAPSFDFGRQEPEREAPSFDFGSNNDSPPPMDFGSDSSSSSSSGSDSWD